MNKLLKYIILQLLVLPTWLPSFSQITGSYAISSDDGNPQILCLKLHSDGYFLTGTSNGLYTFDGSNFSPVSISSSIKSRVITAIAEGKNGTVWLGFKSGEIGVLDNKTAELLKAEEGHPAVAITFILAHPSGDIYFATAGEGVYQYSNQRFHNINMDDGLSDDYVYDMASDNDGIIVTTDRGLNILRIKNGKKEIRSFTSANGLPDNIVRCISPKNITVNNDVNAQYWIGMQDKGIGLYADGKAHQSVNVLSNWTYGQVNSILTSHNQLWIATENHGVVTVEYEDRNMNRIVGISNISSTVGKANNLIEDGEGNIWFASNHRLVKTNGAQLQNIIPIDKITYPQIHSILQDHLKNLWINVNNGLRKYTRNTNTGGWEFRFYKLPQINNKTDITSLYEDRFGNIWVGTMGQGIVIIDPLTGKNRTITEDYLLVDGSVLSISGKENEIWISSLAGAIHCNMGDENKDISKPYTFVNFKNVSGIGSNYVYSILVDSKNRVWFATDGKGITLYENGRFKNYSQNTDIKSRVIYNVCEDKKGNIWFSALNNGLYKFDGRRFTNISTDQGLNDVTITALGVDANNNLIAISKKGVNIINAETHVISYIDHNHAIEEINTDPNCITGTNTLYVVSNKGILRYMPTYKTLSPKIVLNGVQVFLKDVDRSVGSKFSYDENNFTFSYTGISYSHPEKLIYQYKLEGLSNEWVTTKDNSINIPKFPPGKFTFHVRASINNRFDKSNEVSYSFIIKKPVWFRWWFIALVSVAGISAIYFYIKAREKRVKRWERLEKEKIQSQFETLKSQVNPHFLFNSFNTLISVIENNQQKAVEYVEHLSDLYRKIVTYRDKDVISLKEEIEIINDYFFIQKKRFGENLRFYNNISHGDQLRFLIAPLTLQLLTENAVKHNAISSETPLIIELSIHDKMLFVVNNLNSKVVAEKGEGMGLQNIQKRYKLLSNEEIAIRKTSESFIVQIPLFQLNNENNPDYRR